MYDNYQTLAQYVPEDHYFDDANAKEYEVTLFGLTVGDKDLYGTVKARMHHDEDEGYYIPVSVISSDLEDGEEVPVTVDNETLANAMFATHERFGGYFTNEDVKEIY